MKTAFLLVVVACVVASSAQDTYDVVVVGSGLSGLTSAYELSKKGHSVLILEANEDTGGRTKSLYNISIGGTYVPPNNNNILNLADELGIRPRLMSNSVQKIPDSLFYDSSLAESVYQMIEEIVQASPDQSAVFSHPKAIELDRYNIMEWIAMQNCSEEAKTSFFEYYITSENILEEHLPNMSALHAAFFVWTRLRPMSYDWIPTIAWRAISDVDMDLIKGTLQSHFLWRVPQLSFGRTLFPYMFSMWFEGGTGKFAQTLLEATLKLGAELRTSQIVEKVSQEKDYVTVTTTQGTTIQAKNAVLAVGPVALSKIQIENRFDNNEPAGYGTPFTGLNVLLFYDSCWWKGQAYGFMVDSKGADPLLGPAPLLPTACIPGDNALRVLSTAVTTANMTDDEIVNKTVEYICSHHPEIRDQILSYKRTLVWNWPKHNPQITPGFVYSPGYLTKYGKYFLKPHHRVYISGSERSIKGMNWLEGAVTSGLTVAGEIHKSL